MGGSALHCTAAAASGGADAAIRSDPIRCDRPMQTPLQPTPLQPAPLHCACGRMQATRCHSRRSNAPALPLPPRSLGCSGGISSGKSSVSSYLQSPRHGVALLDFDLIAREVVTPGHPSGALQSIRRRFGDGVLQADGSLDRAKLGAIIFGDAQARAKLNKAMQWPIWRTFLLHAGRLFFCEGRREVVLDVPLLFESKISAICSENIVVYTSPDVQKERLMKRGTHTDRQTAGRHAAIAAWATAHFGQSSHCSGLDRLLVLVHPSSALASQALPVGARSFLSL